MDEKVFLSIFASMISSVESMLEELISSEPTFSSQSYWSDLSIFVGSFRMTNKLYDEVRDQKVFSEESMAKCKSDLDNISVRLEKHYTHIRESSKTGLAKLFNALFPSL